MVAPRNRESASPPAWGHPPSAPRRAPGPVPPARAGAARAAPHRSTPRRPTAAARSRGRARRHVSALAPAAERRRSVARRLGAGGDHGGGAVAGALPSGVFYRKDLLPYFLTYLHTIVSTRRVASNFKQDTTRSERRTPRRSFHVAVAPVAGSGLRPLPRRSYPTGHSPTVPHATTPHATNRTQHKDSSRSSRRAPIL